jgi:hypothetical protein
VTKPNVGIDVQFPLFVFETDDRSMYLVETPGSVLYRLDTIDIEDGLYFFLGCDRGGCARYRFA